MIEENEDDNLEERDEEFDNDDASSEMEQILPISGMYRNWFLDYASYVILERAVPALADGLKPVQRRILHSLRELDDGRFHKCANVIGHTMKYHPHGDASIGDALVQLGQKDLLIDTQGNWGNILTGDRAAAPRYIESKLTKFALEVVFNHKTTEWQSSYDGRNKEPINLPAKFPILLAQGGEGIAVGLSTKILPHNFNELIDNSIKVLKGKKPNILPDFPTAGTADFSNYNEGRRGGKVKVRARIRQEDKKTLVITEIPFGTTTSSLIESIIKANEKNKIKIRKIEDNTAADVEIVIHLPGGVSPDKMIDALYAFTDCENSISPNSCTIEKDKPVFVGVNEMLQRSTEQTLELLKLELEIKLRELQEQWHFASLERIFIENRIYRDIEECETWEAVIKAIDKGMHKFIATPSKPNKAKGATKLLRDLTEEDIVKLTEIKIKRISKFDGFKADELIKKLIEGIDEVKDSLANIVDFTIDFFKELKKKYGKGRERKTEIKSFESIVAAKVAVANVKLYVNKDEGFAGTGLRRSDSDFVADCSDIDDVIVIRGDGTLLVSRISSKAFFGKDILHCGIWKKNDERTVFNLIYLDGKGGTTMVKRFCVTSITRDKEYDLTKGKPGSMIMYLTYNPNGESETVSILLRSQVKTKKLKFDFDFGQLAIKGRGAGGNILTKHAVKKVIFKEKGLSTLGARKIWFDDTVQRLNTDEGGEYLGEFSPDDRILTITQSGEFALTGFDLFTKFEDDMIVIEKWNRKKPISAVYFDGEKKLYYIKRFLIETTTKKVSFITEHESSELEVVSTDWLPQFQINFSKVKGEERESEVIKVDEFIDVKGLKARGNQLTKDKVKGIDVLEPLPYDEEIIPEQIITDDSGEALTVDLQVNGQNKIDESEDSGQITLEL